MVRWAGQLELGDMFHDESKPFEQRRDIIVERIRSAVWWDEDDYDLTTITEELSDTEGIDEFDEVWGQFYDWADANRVWVDTFGKR